MYLPYCEASGHSQEWVDAGKTEAAKNCLLNSAKVVAGMIYDMVLDSGLVEKAVEEFETNERDNFSRT